MKQEQLMKGICQSSIKCEVELGNDYCKGTNHPYQKPCPYYIEPDTCPECGHTMSEHGKDGGCTQRDACACKLLPPTQPAPTLREQMPLQEQIAKTKCRYYQGSDYQGCESTASGCDLENVIQCREELNKEIDVFMAWHNKRLEEIAEGLPKAQCRISALQELCECAEAQRNDDKKYILQQREQ